MSLADYVPGPGFIPFVGKSKERKVYDALTTGGITAAAFKLLEFVSLYFDPTAAAEPHMTAIYTAWTMLFTALYAYQDMVWEVLAE